MKRLGTLFLPDQLQWIDRRSWSPVVQTSERTIGGGQIIWSHGLSGGRPITLEAQDGVAWLTLAQVDAIEAMASQPGATFILEWDDLSFIVLFNHADPPAVALEPIWPEHNLFTGTIKLIQG